tara:strand:+ start:453 stop:626 length:174 start_codon:yes stop_codon:yes gene_type:complete
MKEYTLKLTTDQLTILQTALENYHDEIIIIRMDNPDSQLAKHIFPQIETLLKLIREP